MRNGCATCERLLQHLNDRCFVTGTELGKLLKISRAAVHKHIESLKASGLPVDGVSGRGYRLARGVVPIDEAAIRGRLDERSTNLVSRVIVEHSVDSTNSRLMQLSASESIHAVVCISESQPAGRGRRGRRWIATPFRNLLMSVGWVYEGWPRDITGLSVAVGISLIEAMRSLGIDGLGMKWPNDIVIEGKKTGGILIEVTGESSGWCTVVVGVGINAHIAGDDGRSIDQPWTDLETVTGRAIDRNELAAGCISALCCTLQVFPDTGFEPWRMKWADVDVLTGEDVSITTHTNDESTEGVVTGLDSTGALLVEVNGEGTRSLLSGDVSVRAQ